MKNILFIIGSLRKESFNRQLALEAEKMIGSQAEVTYLDYSDVPLINQDIEFPEPEAVGRLRATVKEADAIWVFTPEYNFSYPGHVKNLFDWLSRPLVAGDYETPTVINGKKIALTGTANGYRAEPGSLDRRSYDSYRRTDRLSEGTDRCLPKIHRMKK